MTQDDMRNPKAIDDFVKTFGIDVKKEKYLYLRDVFLECIAVRPLPLKELRSELWALVTCCLD